MYFAVFCSIFRLILIENFQLHYTYFLKQFYKLFRCALTVEGRGSPQGCGYRHPLRPLKLLLSEKLNPFSSWNVKFLFSLFLGLSLESREYLCRIGTGVQWCSRRGQPRNAWIADAPLESHNPCSLSSPVSGMVSGPWRYWPMRRIVPFLLCCGKLGSFRWVCCLNKCYHRMITNTIRDASHSRLATLNYLKLCLTSDRSISAEYEDRFTLGSVLIYPYLCLSRCRKVWTHH